MSYVTWAAIIGLVSAYFLTPRVKSLAVKYKILAHPGGRREHLKPTPMWGGIAMYAGFTLAVVIITFVDPKLYFNNTVVGILLGGSFVALVGALDDKYELPGWFQALSIVIAGCILSLFDIRVVSFTNPFKGGSTIPLGLLSIPATVIWMLMVTKAVDCMDGMDGLSAGISAIAAGTLTLMAINASPKSAEMSAMMEISAVMGAALMGAALGFLRYNYPPAKLFMGTVGSQFLGFILAAISVAGAFKITTLVAVALPVLVLGVPLFDTTFVVLKRMVTRRRIDQADRTHLHHRLANKGLSTRQVIWIIYLITFAFCALAYALFMYVK